MPSWYSWRMGWGELSPSAHVLTQRAPIHPSSSPLQHSVGTDGPVIQHVKAGQLHHEHTAALGAQVQQLPGRMGQDHRDLRGAGGGPVGGGGTGSL